MTWGAMGLSVSESVDKGPVNWIIETKGREDVVVAATDAQMERCCKKVTAVSGTTWRYMKVPQVIFDRGGFSTLASMVREVERASASEGAPIAKSPGREGPPRHRPRHATRLTPDEAAESVDVNSMRTAWNVRNSGASIHVGVS